MKVLVACEESQAVTIAFRNAGHEAWSCDIQECSGGHPEWHIKGDAVKTLWGEKWDLVIAHPPCTRLTNSGVRWLNERKLWYELYEATKFFNQFTLYGKLGHKIAIENPIPHKYATGQIGKYTQIIQPYHFGHMEKKATCLWLYNVHKLRETKNVYEEMMKLPYSERAKVHCCAPGPERAKFRSKTYTGIAEAMAEQWGNLQENTPIESPVQPKLFNCV